MLRFLAVNSRAGPYVCVRDVAELVQKGRLVEAEDEAFPEEGRGRSRMGSLALLVYRLETESDLRGFQEVGGP